MGHFCTTQFPSGKKRRKFLHLSTYLGKPKRGNGWLHGYGGKKYFETATLDTYEEKSSAGSMSDPHL
jgi:hypothetical protein